MAHDVFISHSHKDKQIADAICTNLEVAGVRCWIAPRDIGPGEQWPEAIAREIPQSRVMVMIFSTDSNNSDQVYRELFIAAENKVVIIPFKIEEVELNPRIGFLLAGTHWLDAISPPIQEQVNILVTRVKSILGPTPPPPPKPEPARRIPAWTWLIVTLVLILVIGAASVFLWEKTPKAVPLTSPVPALTNAPEISATQVSGPQSGQARAFAGPILTAIAHRKPDFEDDFSTVNPDWRFDSRRNQGTFTIEKGVARLQIDQYDNGWIQNENALTGKDIVLQLDARIVSGDPTSTIHIRIHLVSEFDFNLNLIPAIQAWAIGSRWNNVFNLPSGQGAVSPIGDTTQVTVITRGSRFALYLNQIPVGYFDNKNLDITGRTIFHCISDSPAVCEFDNIKFWNLANLPALP
jgi:hypothetical protein